jgi:cytochrome P450
VLTHLDPDFLDDPHPAWDRLRALDPVSWVPEVDAWVITGSEALRDAMRHPGLSPSVRYWKAHVPPDAVAEPSPQERFHATGLFNVSPEDHLRLRRLVNRAFTPRGVEDQAPFTAALVEALIEPFGPGDEIDLFTEVYERIPVRVISHLVGFPDDYGEAFTRASDTLILTLEPSHDADTSQAIDAAIVEIETMIEACAAERRRRPAADLLSRMLAVEDDGDRLSFEEMVSLVLGLVIAGSGTTANLMAVATHDLLAHPAQWHRFAHDPGARPGAVEELLRFTTLGYGAPRFAVDDVELGGHAIAGGDLVLCPFAAANHDPVAWPDPHRLDLARPPSSHLAFSLGPHYCLGANLARLEIATTLGAVADRFPGLAPNGPTAWRHSFLFRNVVSLPVRL